MARIFCSASSWDNKHLGYVRNRRIPCRRNDLLDDVELTLDCRILSASDRVLDWAELAVEVGVVAATGTRPTVVVIADISGVRSAESVVKLRVEDRVVDCSRWFLRGVSRLASLNLFRWRSRSPKSEAGRPVLLNKADSIG